VSRVFKGLTVVAASVHDRFATLVGEGAIEPDPAQQLLVAKLDRLADALADYRLPGRPGVLGRLFGARPAPAPLGSTFTAPSGAARRS